MNKEEHIKRHRELHSSLDELCADFFTHTGKFFSDTSIMDLMKWSNKQTTNPNETLQLFHYHTDEVLEDKKETLKE